MNVIHRARRRTRERTPAVLRARAQELARFLALPSQPIGIYTFEVSVPLALFGHFTRGEP